jgi:TolB protein
MASSLALAGCGEAGDLEASAPPEPSATQSQRLDEGVSNDRRIIVYQTPSLQLYYVDNKGISRLVAQRTSAPVVSPDGRQVAYAKLPDTWNAGDPVVRSELYVLDGASGRSTQLTRGYDDTEPVWTPDGHSVLFQSTQRTGVPSLWKVRDNGSGIAQVTNQGCLTSSSSYIPNPASSETVEWSFDRRIIVYTTTSFSGGDVRVIRFDPTLNVLAAYSLGQGFAPEWTEQGTVIFQRNVDGQVVSVEVSVN